MTLTRRQSARLETLRRRRDFLSVDITAPRRAYGGMSYDKAEASALTWAIEFIEEATRCCEHDPEHSRSECGLCGDQESWCAKCAAQLCSCAS